MDQVREWIHLPYWASTVSITPHDMRTSFTTHAKIQVIKHYAIA
jgi:hypothetical protein